MTRFPSGLAVGLAVSLALSGCSVTTLASSLGDVRERVAEASASSSPPSAAPVTATPTPSASSKKPTQPVSLPKADIGASPDVEALRRAVVEASLELRTATFEGVIATKAGKRTQQMQLWGAFDRTDPGHVLMEVTLQDEGGEPFTYIRDGATHWLQAGEGEFAPATAEDLAREGVLLPELDVAAELNKVFALPGRWTYEGTAYEAGEPFEHYRLAISAAALTGTKGAAGKKDVLVADYYFDKFAHPVFMSSSAPAAGVTIEVTYSPLNQNVNIVIPS